MYCPSDLGLGYHVDHITSLARGGENKDENIQLLCPKCNLSKGAKGPLEFLVGKSPEFQSAFRLRYARAQ